MRDLLRIAVPLAALALAPACATTPPRPPEMREGPAAAAIPVPDPACAENVQRALLVTNVEQVQVRVTLLDQRAVRLSLLAPELTPAQAEEMRSACADCPWRPGENGEPTGTVTFGRTH
jgi:hypothetical protein